MIQVWGWKYVSPLRSGALLAASLFVGGASNGFGQEGGVAQESQPPLVLAADAAVDPGEWRDLLEQLEARVKELEEGQKASSSKPSSTSKPEESKGPAQAKLPEDKWKVSFGGHLQFHRVSRLASCLRCG